MLSLKFLKQAVTALEESGAAYCLAGGHAASLYRSQERFTKDVDFALMANPPSDSQKIATQLIERLGMTPIIGFILPGPKETIQKPIPLITSTPAQNETKGIIDILLPELPWIPKAIERAQHNRIDLGFAAVPVVTPEDLIIAKCYALNNALDRFQDLDDLKEMLGSVDDLDIDYLRSNLTALRLDIPSPVRKFAPPRL